MMIARAGCAVSKLSFAATTNFHFKSLPLKTLSVSVGVQERTFCRVNCEKRNMAVQLRESVELTEVEEKIFERLRKVLLHFNLPTQLRVAGGWVRDKLLGKDSSDIDIALDDMLGREFCDKVNEYLANAGEKTQGVGVIQCNPDQSKHLETARMRIYDMWIDFVNLRSETYVEHSRIPHMKFGTAKEDAYRRDLTINSLFYNINTGSVEDLTGRGISDLKAGVIATPLPPKDTFLDDPLRVLRAIRFGARFEFKLDDDLKKAVVDKDVRAALATKISPERIGHEIDLMVSGNQPVKAIGQIEELQLFWTVFCLPQNLEAKLPQDCERACVKSLEALSEVLGKVGFSTLSDDHGRLCLYSALFLPLRNVNYSNRKGKTIPVVSAIIKDSLKLKTKDADMVLSLHDAGEEFTGLIDILISDKHAGNLTPSINEEDDLGISLMSTKCIQTGLENVWEMKHLLDGNDIIHELGLKKGGTEVKEWKERIRKWQLANLSGTREECLEWLHQVRAKRLKTDS
ncbi:tRNA nucleotidyltransferase cca2 isoform X2 [Cryptomeria japonica]|uniref:tRNA nucleotidyltransferase cca2 isoform X2 n=1 Tax=Cryptomeria japonica TaxID=3369 RepID=UPI0027DA3D9E|nr:tRNA nucleotidyltransferase cca2 isoform X2 [Cryptomeria japonica]